MSAREILLTVAFSVVALTVLLVALSDLAVAAVKRKRKKEYRIYDACVPSGATVFLGDSHTEFYPLHQLFPAAPAVNRGVGGETTAEVAARLDGVLALSPRQIVLQVGVNDFLFHPSKAPKAVAEAITALCNRILSEGVALTLVALFPVNKGKTPISAIVCRFATNKKISEANNLLRAYAKKEGIPFVEADALLSDSRGRLKREYTTEGLHLSLRGYLALTEAIAPHLQGCGKVASVGERGIARKR